MGYPKLECRTEKSEYHKNESEYDELKAEYEETEHIKDNLYPGYFVLEKIINLLIIKKFSINISSLTSFSETHCSWCPEKNKYLCWEIDQFGDRKENSETFWIEKTDESDDLYELSEGEWLSDWYDESDAYGWDKSTYESEYLDRHRYLKTENVLEHNKQIHAGNKT